MTPSLKPASVCPSPALTALALGFWAVLAAPDPAAAQRRQPDTVFSVDAEWMGVGAGYARATAPGRYWGLEAGLGGSFWSRMLVAGPRFSHESEGGVDTELMELVRVGAFRRWNPSERVSWDVGVRAALLYNTGPFDDDPAFPLFTGAYANVMVGNRRVQVGPRILAGLFSDASGAREMGLYLVPLTGRVTFGW